MTTSRLSLTTLRTLRVDRTDSLPPAQNADPSNSNATAWAAAVKRGPANRRALELTANPAEKALRRRRIDWGDDAG